MCIPRRYTYICDMTNSNQFGVLWIMKKFLDLKYYLRVGQDGFHKVVPQNLQSSVIDKQVSFNESLFRNGDLIVSVFFWQKKID